MANFTFLQTQPQYALFAPACTEAEKIYASAPAMCAVGCRKALELAVKWVYSADTSMEMPYKDNLQSLIHEPSFRNSVDVVVWKKLPFIVKLGNLAVHTERSVQKSDALTALKGLFDFVRWIDFCYGENYTERTFDENLIPKGTVVINVKKIKEQKSLLEEKEAEIEALRKKIAELSGHYTAEKEHHREERTFRVEDISEFETRKTYIDVDLKYLGWKFTGADADVQEEYPVEDMDNIPGQNGFVDYVLFGKDGLPLAVIEAKRTGKDPNTGRKQAVLYADALERKFGRRPMIFTTNGFETFFWDDTISPQRKVSGVFSKDDLQKLMNRRSTGEELRELFAKLRSRIPGLVIRTSIITGLPGEGEEEFSELCEFLKEQRLERVGAFPFSPEEGTPAYDMPHVDEDEAQKRAQMVEEIQSRIMDECNMALMGKTLEVLVDAALHAPSGKGLQTWKFTVITNKDAIARLVAAIGTELKRDGYDMYHPAAIIMPSNITDGIWSKEDNACALENIFLAAHSLGIGSVWINQMQNICDAPAIREILNDFGVPENHSVFGMAALGYPAPDAPIAPIRRTGTVTYIE